jgi:UDP-glucose 4-epimerase
LLTLLSVLQRLLQTKIEPRHEPPRTGDIRDSLADISAARRLLGYEPVVGLEEGLRRSIDYYRSVLAS